MVWTFSREIVKLKRDEFDFRAKSVNVHGKGDKNEIKLCYT